MAESNYCRADLCITAAAEAWRGDGAILASGMGLIPRLAAGLAASTFSPDLLLNDAECTLVSEPVPVGPRGDYQLKQEGYLPFRKVFELLWGGRRHTMTMPTQLDRFGHCNISSIGDYAKPKVQLLGVRGIPGNSIHHPSSYFVPSHSTRTLVPAVDMVSGVGYDDSRWPAGVKRDYMEIRRVISNLGVLDFAGPNHQMRLLSVHPWSSVDEVKESTGFELAMADEVGVTPEPTAEQLEIIARLDPHGQRIEAIK